jgi:hypothetical protein
VSQKNLPLCQLFEGRGDSMFAGIFKREARSANMDTMRKASCRCGQLSLICTGDPVRVSVCHCHDCQRRSGSAFAAQARFKPEHVEISGEAQIWEGSGDSGNVAAFHFCPQCGSTAYYVATAQSDLIAVPVGAFADSHFPKPDYSVYEGRKQAWVAIVGDGIDRFD